eukprot:TRINITY_DN4413_c0_g1_i1.p1 TRINITY_DN4413_c0_g1~~TRINITY_DN4413_c0_g1_i1.p1  ORF type:complete len:318 (+),score=58.70 TRINITY_DN4413_c0_g1_i1:55-954(+)
MRNRLGIMSATTLFLFVLLFGLIVTTTCVSSGGKGGGVIQVGVAWSDVVPLSGSLIVVGDMSNNSLNLMDVDTNSTLIQARVNLLARSVRYLHLPCVAQSASMSQDTLFLLCPGISVVYVDKCTLNVMSHTTTVYDPAANTIVASYDSKYFITGDLSSSTSSALNRYEWDGGKESYQLNEKGITSSNGNTLVLSPDNKHVLMVAGGGNGNGYSISDINAMNFTDQYGAFVTGAYPLGGFYSPDQTKFATSNYDTILVLDATRYNVVEKYPIVKSDPYFQMISVRYSLDGARVYSYPLRT